MGRLSNLNKRDIKLVKSLNKVLELYGLSDEDLESLKDIKTLKEDNEVLRIRVDALEDTINQLLKSRVESQYYYNDEGERLKDEREMF